MKSAIILSTLVLAAAGAQAQSVWRCANNVYTNVAAEAKAKGCKAVEGGNVTVVEGTRVSNSGNGGSTRIATAAPASPSSQRIDSAEQRARDSDARLILETELKKAEAQREELLREWNNGEPEKLGPEHRNHQKYLDRVADLKASIARNESDIAGLKRELGRVAK